ncbi:hypothetical protein EYF80_001137 [Liparis tanakae]|uniref:Uncharacterized protein n=1 Tax=Liparis tanakae TaxID=230148 RepID=A0A4Z2JEW0_9TELE|nr:hypothetical protein EYF80_001137 [Liparis tanakae]
MQNHDRDEDRWRKRRQRSRGGCRRVAEREGGVRTAKRDNTESRATPCEGGNGQEDERSQRGGKKKGNGGDSDRRQTTAHYYCKEEMEVKRDNREATALVLKKRNGHKTYQQLREAVFKRRKRLKTKQLLVETSDRNQEAQRSGEKSNATGCGTGQKLRYCTKLEFKGCCGPGYRTQEVLRLVLLLLRKERGRRLSRRLRHRTRVSVPEGLYSGVVGVRVVVFNIWIRHHAAAAAAAALLVPAPVLPQLRVPCLDPDGQTEREMRRLWM